MHTGWQSREGSRRKGKGSSRQESCVHRLPGVRWRLPRAQQLGVRWWRGQCQRSWTFVTIPACVWMTPALMERPAQKGQSVLHHVGSTRLRRFFSQEWPAGRFQCASCPYFMGAEGTMALLTGPERGAVQLEWTPLMPMHPQPVGRDTARHVPVTGWDCRWASKPWRCLLTPAEWGRGWPPSLHM